MASDHELFIGGDDVAGHARSWTGDQLFARSIGLSIQFQAEPLKPLRHGLPDCRCIFADARREDERVNAAHRGDEHPGEKGNPVDEVIEREPGVRVLAGEKFTDVIADAGQSLETAVAVEKMLKFLRAHPFLTQEIEQDTGVDLACSRTHGQAIETSEAHRAVEALASGDGAHRGAAAEMRYHNPGSGYLGR